MAQELGTETAEPSISLGDVYQDRDLSWLEFNRRVLHEAQDDRTPLLERLKFLAIFSSNLDEFFMKRIELLKRRGADGQKGEGEALRGIRDRLLSMIREQALTFTATVSELKQHGISLAEWDELSIEQRDEARTYFLASASSLAHSSGVRHVAPVPISLEPVHVIGGHPAKSRDRRTLFCADQSAQCAAAGGLLFAPRGQDRPTCFVRQHDILRHNLDAVFPGMEIIDATLFRVTRDADVELDEDLRRCARAGCRAD